MTVVEASPAPSRFAVTDEQRQLRQEVRRFLERYSPESEVRRLMETDSGHDPSVWHQLVNQFGLPGMGIPEPQGGLGFGLVEQAIVFEEAGRALLCSPLFATVALAVNALLCGADQAAGDEMLSAIAAGERTACLAFGGDGTSWNPADWAAGTATATATAADGGAAPAADGGWRLDGHKAYVVDGGTADIILVVARAPQGLTLFAVQPSAPGLERVATDVIDPTRKLFRLTFAATPARRLGPIGRAEEGLRPAFDRAAVLLAAEQLGGAQRCLELSVEHARSRVQFGRPIGSFQAVKHRCADMLVAVESARSAVQAAAWTADHDPTDLAVAASLAKAVCSDTYQRVAADTVQIHGGTGFTWEHRAHLYLKRAAASAAMLGVSVEHRKRLADLLDGAADRL